MADELSRVSDKWKWSKPPETEEIEKLAELAALAGYYALEDLLDTLAAERDHPFNLILAREGA